jgi:hypothetical protein
LAAPAGVNPEKPTVAPFGINAAASSAVSVGAGVWNVMVIYER